MDTQKTEPQFPEVAPSELFQHFDEKSGRYWISFPLMGTDWETIKLFVSGQALLAARIAWLKLSEIARQAFEQQQEREKTERARIQSQNAKNGLMQKAAGMFKGR